MDEITTQHQPSTLREHLRAATRDLHDQLDAQLGPLAMEGAPQYARFLAVQWHARRPIEDWLERSGDAGLPPPPRQTPLISADLAALGVDQPEAAKPLELPTDRLTALGVTWVLAGSAMGNKAMHVRLARTQPDFPVAFLSDGAMARYWRDLRPLIESRMDDAESAPAVMAANEIFTRFLHAFRQIAVKEVA